MALADDLAYMTATEMAARIRRRQLSPVEVVDAVIERIEERNPSLNAFVFKGYDDARQRAEVGEQQCSSRSGGSKAESDPGAVCERNVPAGCSKRSSVTPNAASKSETLPASTTRRFAAQLSMTLRWLARA